MIRSQVDDVAALVGLTDKEMAFALNMTPRNLHRLHDDQRFGVDASERLLLLRNLLIHALDTVTGFGLADDVLGRLDYGLPA